jgi:hypothetical protein
MTTCAEWKDGLLDLALGASASSELEVHLKTCPVCSEALTELRARRQQMDETLPKMMHGFEPSVAFRARLMASLEELPLRTREWPMRAAVIAAAAVIVVVALFLSPRHWRIGPSAPHKASIVRDGLERWQSPTAHLLHSSANGLLQAGPQLGRFYFPLQSTPSLSGRRQKRTGVNK